MDEKSNQMINYITFFYNDQLFFLAKKIELHYFLFIYYSFIIVFISLKKNI